MKSHRSQRKNGEKPQITSHRRNGPSGPPYMHGPLIILLFLHSRPCSVSTGALKVHAYACDTCVFNQTSMVSQAPQTCLRHLLGNRPYILYKALVQ